MKYKTIFLAGSIFLFFIYSWTIKQDNPKPIIKITEQKRQLNVNKQALKVMSLGQERLISSLLWVQTLMESDLEHYKNKDLNSWMFLRFDAITELDPNFYEAYLWGGIYLSIIKNDAIGAKALYDKGLKVFPKDIDLNFNSGFNNFFELSKSLDAIKNFEVIVKDPVGSKRFKKLFGLYQKLKYSTGIPYQEIFDVIHQKFQNETNPRLKQYYEKQLFDIRTTEDLKCLNSTNEPSQNCRNNNLYGELYIYDKKGQYLSPRKYTPYQPSTQE